MPDTPRKNLVIGAAVGYRPAHVAPFLVSLRRSGYNGDIVLLVDADLKRQLLGTALGRGLNLQVVRQWLPFRLRLHIGRRRRLFAFWYPLRAALWILLRLTDVLPMALAWRRRFQIALAARLHPPHQTRFFDYQRFIEASDHTHILMTDVRDVLFQDDPFNHLPESGLAVSIEPRRYTLATEAHNALWIQLAYGGQMLSRIGDRPVSCSGVTYGDRKSILRYLDKMTDAIIGLRFSATDRPLDQAPHNVLVWTGEVGECCLMETFSSPVATLNVVNEGELSFDARGYLVNDDGSPICVVHMYDRWPSLKSRLLHGLTSDVSFPGPIPVQ